MEKQIINKVQEYRDRQKITQESLAKSVGVTRQTIISIEKGNYTPSVKLALELANYFNVPVEELFIMEVS